MTDLRREAEAVVEKVKSELPDIWLGGRQKMVLIDAIEAFAKAQTEALQAKLNNQRTLIAVLCGHQVDEPLFKVIDPVECVRERLDVLQRQLDEAKAKLS